MNSSSDFEIHLRDYLYVLRKRRFAFYVFFVLCIVLAGAATYFAKTIYLSSVTILIERENPNITDFKEVMAMDASLTEYYQTQYQMIKSRSLVSQLIKEEKMMEDEYFRQMLGGGLKQKLSKQSWFPAWLKPSTAPLAPDEILIRRMLRVDPVRNSRLVEVGVTHADPERAAALANKLIALYIERNLQDRFSVSKQATDLISGQLTELKDKVAKADKNLQSYKEEKGLVSIPSIRESNKFIEDAKLELVKIQAEESKLSKRYLPAHPKRIHIRSQIEGLEEKIKEEEQKMMSLSDDAIGYQELEREAESARQIYRSLLKRMQETTSEAKTQASNVMIVDKAQPPTRPYKPNPFLNILIGIFLGFSGGILLVFFLEYLDSTIKIPEDIEKGLGLDLLGIIPEENQKAFQNGQLLLDAQQHSAAAESIRALRTALLFKLRKVAGCRAILVSSPNPEEGKSTVALNLAVAFQQNHLKVVILDADLRKPRLHKMLKLPAEKGMTDILEGQVTFNQTLKKVDDVELEVITCGAMSPHSTELLGSKAMRQLMENLKAEYDVIILDGPPYLAVADVAVLSELADAMVVVARYQRTDKRHLRNLKRRFSDPHIQELGVVINRVSVKEKDYYYHQYYYYGYGDAKAGR